MNSKNYSSPTYSGISYLFRGFTLAFTPGIRRFVVIPLLTNLCLMSLLVGFVLSKLTIWIDTWLSYLPSWLNWLSYLLWPLLALMLLLACSYLFSTLSNLIAAPFNGLLAEHLECKLTGKRPPDEGILDLIKDSGRMFKRELQKLGYYLPKLLGLFILSWIPFIGQTLIPLCWLLFNAWMMAIQYCDYAFDNHKVPFATMKTALKTNRSQSMGFGAGVAFFTLIPIVNIFVMPAAVCGATAMWVDRYRNLHARY